MEMTFPGMLLLSCVTSVSLRPLSERPRPFSVKLRSLSQRLRRSSGNERWRSPCYADDGNEVNDSIPWDDENLPIPHFTDQDTFRHVNEKCRDTIHLLDGLLTSRRSPMMDMMSRYFPPYGDEPVGNRQNHGFCYDPNIDFESLNLTSFVNCTRYQPDLLLQDCYNAIRFGAGVLELMRASVESSAANDNIVLLNIIEKIYGLMCSLVDLSSVSIDASSNVLEVELAQQVINLQRFNLSQKDEFIYFISLIVRTVVQNVLYLSNDCIDIGYK